MMYFETELVFTPGGPATKTAARSPGNLWDEKGPVSDQTEVLGITLRLGNKPLVYSLKELSRRSGKPALLSGQDHYLVIHAISALRTRGNARIDELQYFAVAVQPEGFQTVDLIPKTRFNEIIRADLGLKGCLDLFGEVSLDVPSAMMDLLLNEIVNLAPGMQLQLSASARFIGKLVYTLQIPVVQSSGIGSDTCSWILTPDENKTPLIGDQLLIQSIAVPKGTNKLSYTISGLVKADKGIFWKQQEKRTPDYKIEVDLDYINSKPQV